jgi:hypothetical protein
MVTPPDIEAQILRFYHAEKWTIGTIARQLHVHNGVVRRVLAQAGLPAAGRPLLRERRHPDDGGNALRRFAGRAEPLRAREPG